MNYTLKELLDIPRLQELLDSLNEVRSMPSAIIDTEGNVLTATAWQEICTEFHRKNPKTQRKCAECCKSISARLDALESHIIYRCPLGLVDTATPIIIEGKHIGNVFTGQLFTTSPDESFFIQQARKYGFAEDDYLAALRKVPLISEEQLHRNLNFVGNLAHVLAEQGLLSLRHQKAAEAIKKSETRHRTILRTAMDGIWLADRELQLLEVNHAYCQMSGYNAHELLAMNVSDLAAGGTAEKLAARLLHIIETGAARFESRLRRKNGTVFDVEISAQFRDEDGGQFVLFLHDITERKRVEAYRSMGKDILLILNKPESRKAITQRIIGLVKSATGVDAVGIRLQEGDDFPYFYQEGFSQDFLQKENSLLGRTRDGGICRDDGGNICLECACGLVISGKTDPANPYFTKGGSAWTNDSFPPLHIAAVADPRLNPRDECIHQGFASVALIPIRAKGNIAGLLQLNSYKKGIFTLEGIETLEDIAENIGEAMLRKEAEERLIASERFLRKLTDNLPDMVGYWSRELCCDFANQAYREWFGRTPEEVIGMSVQEFLGEELYRQNEPYLQGVLLGEPQHFEWTLVKPSGETGYTWAHYLPDLVRGKVRGFFVLVSDITKLKKAEAEKIKLETQLVQAQKVESIGRLAGGVAHDFNNMLSVILGHAEMTLIHMDPDQPIYASIKEISKAAERSADLTRQLLSFARKQTIAPKVVDLNEAVAEMFNMLQRLIGENIHLTWRPGTHLWPVLIDPSQIDQIMANLCVNSRDAIADIGEITIETGKSFIDANYCIAHPYAAPGDYVKVAVSDNGTGMDKETLKNMFDPFFTTKGVGEGTGLGLATVYGIVRQNKGFINVYSEPGMGTTFTIYLPRHEGDAKQTQPEAETDSLHHGHETILLVEDEPMILEMSALLLTELGYSVLKAGSPGEGIRLAQEHGGEIHLLMTDVIMPEMNGRELAKNLSSRYPQIKLLFMSGYTADIIAHQGIIEDGVHFIQKPFQLNALAEKLREVLAN